MTSPSKIKIIKSVEKSPTFLPNIQNKPASGERIIRVSLNKRTRIDKNSLGVNGVWKFDKVLGTEGQVGFVYIVKDILENKFYIGRKYYLGSGIKNKNKESNWQWYTTSNKYLSESIKKNGRDFFEFFVIEEYCSRGAVSFAETWTLCTVEALSSDKFYNGLIEKVSWKVKEKITDKHKERMKLILNGEDHFLKEV